MVAVPFIGTGGARLLPLCAGDVLVVRFDRQNQQQVRRDEVRAGQVETIPGEEALRKVRDAVKG